MRGFGQTLDKAMIDRRHVSPKILWRFNRPSWAIYGMRRSGRDIYGTMSIGYYSTAISA